MEGMFWLIPQAQNLEFYFRQIYLSLSCLLISFI